MNAAETGAARDDLRAADPTHVDVWQGVLQACLAALAARAWKLWQPVKGGWAVRYLLGGAKSLGISMADQRVDLLELVDAFRRGTTALSEMAKALNFPWAPGDGDPRRAHNAYARSLVTSYVTKFSYLSDAVLNAVDEQNFLVYGLAGRALIEHTAVLRYYVTEEYAPLFSKGHLGQDDFRHLLEVDDRHLRGSRFDWSLFFDRNYSQLKQNVIEGLVAKRKKSPSSQAPGPQQVNVLTCIENWARDTPEVLIFYNVFCDLVHPNIGSSLLVSSASDEGLYFSPFRGEPTGRAIVAQTFPMLCSVTHKPFGTFLTRLMGTIWQDDELPRP